MGKVYPIKHATKMSIYREALQKSWNPTARPPYGREGPSNNTSHFPKLNVSSVRTIFCDTFNKKHTHKLYKHTNYTNTQIIQTHNYTNTQLYKHANYTNTHKLYKHTQLYLTTIILTNTPLVIQEGPDPGFV